MFLVPSRNSAVSLIFCAATTTGMTDFLRWFSVRLDNLQGEEGDLETERAIRWTSRSTVSTAFRLMLSRGWRRRKLASGMTRLTVDWGRSWTSGPRWAPYDTLALLTSHTHFYNTAWTDKTVAALQNGGARRQAAGGLGEHASKTMHHHSSYHSLDDAQFCGRWGDADAGYLGRYRYSDAIRLCGYCQSFAQL